MAGHQCWWQGHVLHPQGHQAALAVLRGTRGAVALSSSRHTCPQGGIRAVHHRTDMPGAGVERSGMWCPQITGPVHPSTLGMPGHPWTPQHPAAHLLQHLIPTAALHRTGGEQRQ